MDNLEKMLAALREEVAEVDLPTRSLVAGLVMRGQITRERAEEWARDRGKAPFERHPEQAEFDPMDETEWSLAMTLAWIDKRTPDAVRGAWGDYLSKCWAWKPYKEIEAWEKAPGGRRKFVGGYELKQLHTPHLSGVPAPAAKRQLLMTALRKGDLKAYSGRDPNPIPDREWEEFSPFTLILPYSQIHHDAVFDDNGALQFKRVRVKSANVMDLWKATPIVAKGTAARISSTPKHEHGQAGVDSRVVKTQQIIREQVQRLGTDDFDALLEAVKLEQKQAGINLRCTPRSLRDKLKDIR